MDDAVPAEAQPPQFAGPGAPDCPACHGMGYVRLDVPVDHPQFGKMLPCPCRQTELMEKRLQTLRALSNLQALTQYNFSTFKPEGREVTSLGMAQALAPEQRESLRAAYEEAQAFAASPQGWLILRGGYGCGKTHLAAAIANARGEAGSPALFVNVPDLLDYLRASFGPAAESSYAERFDMICHCELLILDDLGTESATQWVQEKLYQIFNTRYLLRLPTVITTNRAMEEIDLRIRSRMYDTPFCRIVNISAPDYRQLGVQRDQFELSSLNLHENQTFDTFDLRRNLPRTEQSDLQYAFEAAREYAQAPEGWLLFTGGYGCGKTHLAAAIANYQHQAAGSRAALFVVVPDLLDHLRATFSPQSSVSYDKRFDEIRNAPLLVLDDLGTESATAWAREKLYQLLNYRFNARLPTVITMAMTLDELANTDPRLAARIASGQCRIVAIRTSAYKTVQPTPRGKKRPAARADTAR